MLQQQIDFCSTLRFRINESNVRTAAALQSASLLAVAWYSTPLVCDFIVEGTRRDKSFRLQTILSGVCAIRRNAWAEGRINSNSFINDRNTRAVIRGDSPFSLPLSLTPSDRPTLPRREIVCLCATTQLSGGLMHIDGATSSDKK